MCVLLIANEHEPHWPTNSIRARRCQNTILSAVHEGDLIPITVIAIIIIIIVVADGLLARRPTDYYHNVCKSPRIASDTTSEPAIQPSCCCSAARFFKWR